MQRSWLQRSLLKRNQHATADVSSAPSSLLNVNSSRCDGSNNPGLSSRGRKKKAWLTLHSRRHNHEQQVRLPSASRATGLVYARNSSNTTAADGDFAAKDKAPGTIVFNRSMRQGSDASPREGAHCSPSSKQPPKSRTASGTEQPTASTASGAAVVVIPILSPHYHPASFLFPKAQMQQKTLQHPCRNKSLPPQGELLTPHVPSDTIHRDDEADKVLTCSVSSEIDNGIVHGLELLGDDGMPQDSFHCSSSSSGASVSVASSAITSWAANVTREKDNGIQCRSSSGDAALRPPRPMGPHPKYPQPATFLQVIGVLQKELSQQTVRHKQQIDLKDLKLRMRQAESERLMIRVEQLATQLSTALAALARMAQPPSSLLLQPLESSSASPLQAQDPAQCE